MDQAPIVRTVRGTEIATKIQNRAEIWKPDPSVVPKVNRFIPKMDCERGRSVGAFLHEKRTHRYKASREVDQGHKGNNTDSCTVIDSFFRQIQHVIANGFCCSLTFQIKCRYQLQRAFNRLFRRSLNGGFGLTSFKVPWIRFSKTSVLIK